MAMCVLDANSYLSLYTDKEDSLNYVKDILGKAKTGVVTLVTTRQIIDETNRMIENRLQLCIKELKDVKFPERLQQAPRNSPLAESYQLQVNNLRATHANLLKDFIEASRSQDDAVTHHIRELFKVATVFELESGLFAKANERCARLNPPGKDRKVGDALTWEILLHHVPAGTNLNIISNDGDFISELEYPTPQPKSVLKGEWLRHKQAEICVYRSIKDYLGA